MKKGLILGLLLTSSLLLVGCGNRQVFDTSWTFEKAIIVIGDEKIEVDVDSWKDYEDTTVQIKTKDGKVYLTDIKNVLMVSE